MENEGLIKNDVKEFFEKLFDDLYKNLTKKFGVINLWSDNQFPPEINITLEFANLIAEKKLLIFAECNMGRGGRRDLVIVNPINKWICQVEVKHITLKSDSDETVLDDIWRIATLDYFEDYLEGKKFNEELLSEYDKYGLFIGGGKSYDYRWWQLDKGENYKEDALNYLKSCNFGDRAEFYIENLEDWFNQPESINGILPNLIQQGKLWIGYYLIKCDYEETY
jgi:hypothetical protein